MDILEVHQVTDEIMAAFERLVPQLSSSGRKPSREEITQIVESPASVLYIARDPDRQGEIIGTLTLAMYRIPTGLKAWIEDVVVDESARGKRVGEMLCLAAIERAKTAGAKGVDLTSRPSREAANRLYQRMGFQKRDTNSYRFNFPKED
jgi:ribosomal protein S18 acetylase RimI-like enzyme